MGNVFEVILTTPFRDYTAGRVVEAGLDALGFSTPAGEDRTVWLRLGLKLPTRMSLDGLRDAVLALPWLDHGAPTDLHVLWADDHTTSDDGWGGRTAPYAYQHEVWEVPHPRRKDTSR